MTAEPTVGGVSGNAAYNSVAEVGHCAHCHPDCPITADNWDHTSDPARVAWVDGECPYCRADEEKRAAAYEAAGAALRSRPADAPVVRLDDVFSESWTPPAHGLGMSRKNFDQCRFASDGKRCVRWSGHPGLHRSGTFEWSRSDYDMGYETGYRHGRYDEREGAPDA